VPPAPRFALKPVLFVMLDLLLRVVGDRPQRRLHIGI
jgi:hypothetical protein